MCADLQSASAADDRPGTASQGCSLRDVPPWSDAVVVCGIRHDRHTRGAAARVHRTHRVSTAIVGAAAFAVLVVLTSVLFGGARGIPSLGAGPVPALDCSGPGIASGNLSLYASACQSLFGGQYGESGTASSFNFSADVPYVAEVTPSGQVVRLANYLGPYAGNVTRVNNSTPSTLRTDLIAEYSANTTSAAGGWNTSNAISGDGWGWSEASPALGTSSMKLVWHVSLDPAVAISNGSYHLKLDVAIDNWSWADRHDRLGIVVDELAPGGSHFSYNPLNRTLSVYPDSGSNGTNGSGGSPGQWLGGLQFGDNASYSSSGGPVSTASVAVMVQLGGSPARVADAVLTFNSSTGNYSHLEYDPWLLFASGNVPPHRVVSPPPATRAVGGVPYEFIAGVAVAGGAAIAASTLAYRRGKARRRVEGRELARKLRESEWTAAARSQPDLWRPK